MKSKLTTSPIEREAEEDHALWNQSVKLASMLYHWKLVDNYESILRLFCIHRKYLEQERFKHDNKFLPQLEAQLPTVEGARIWACFHIGPYALMARALIRQGYGIAVLLKDDVFEEQHPVYVQQFKRSFGREPNAAELQFVRSSGSTSLLQLKQLLKKGFHVISYIDGEEGGSEEKGWIDIQLHGRPVGVRVGMALLSHWTGVPIRPIVLTAVGEQLTLRSREDLYVNDRRQYQATMQYCYNLLEELSVEEILQWECIPKLFDRIAPHLPATADKTPIWLPVYVTGKTMLLDIVSGKCAEVPSTQFESIDRLRKEFLSQIK